MTSPQQGGASAAEEKGAWLHAWHDPVAGIKTHSACVKLVDLNSDGDWKLLIADFNRKLKVVKGTSMQSEHALLDVPASLAVFYPDGNVPRTPAVAVASGPHVFIYRNLRPYYKFTLPASEVDPQEIDVWARANKAIFNDEETYEALSQARDNGVRLSARSLDLLAMRDPDKRRTFVDEHKDLPHIQQTVVTCMSKINKDSNDDDGVSSLVLGTESGRIFILESNGTSIATSAKVPSEPVHISATGILDVEWRIVVACRNNKLYSIKNGDSRGTAVLVGGCIDLDYATVTLARWDRTIYLGDMANYFHSMTLRGRKNFSIRMPCPIQDLEVMPLRRHRVPHVVLVGLNNGQVHMYNEKWLVATLNVDGPVRALRCGGYGREENALVIVHGAGALSVKMLRRTAAIGVDSTTPSIPVDQDTPLAMPKKTKLYLEHAQREREQAPSIHHNFQKDLCRLRLETARAYLKTLTSADMGMAPISSSTVRIYATVQGLGPLFRLMVVLQNSAQTALTDVALMMSYDASIYHVPKPSIGIPLLLPGLENRVAVDVRAIDSFGRSGVIRIFVVQGDNTVPMVTAALTMPRCEVFPAAEQQGYAP